MASACTDPVLDAVSRIADYDALREVAAQLAGILTARQLAGGDWARVWQAERRALLTELDQILPGTPAVTAALIRWATRLAELRQAGR